MNGLQLAEANNADTPICHSIRSTANHVAALLDEMRAKRQAILEFLAAEGN